MTGLTCIKTQPNHGPVWQSSITLLMREMRRGLLIMQLSQLYDVKLAAMLWVMIVGREKRAPSQAGKGKRKQEWQPRQRRNRSANEDPESPIPLN